MMWHTHAAMGASVTWLLLPVLPEDGTVSVSVLMAFCVIGAMMPDLDAAESKIKHVKVVGIKPLVPVSKAINHEFGHRGLLHSLRGWAGWTLMALTLSAVFGWLPVAALSLGYASHLAGDACTRTGIPLLYPQHRRYFLLPQRLRITTASEFEELFFVTFAVITIILVTTSL